MSSLAVIGYILPSQSDELIIQNIESYGSNFWDSIYAELWFKNEISDTLKQKLDYYHIKYKTGVDGLWLDVMLKLASSIKLTYIMFFFEDIKITNEEGFLNSIETLELNFADFMPTLGYSHWNNIAEVFKKYLKHPVESDGEFQLMHWGTYESLLCEQDLIKKELGINGSVPYPISLAGIFKTKFFLNTVVQMMHSNYWKNVTINPDHYVHGDWAMNPKLPHSYEVYWVHNKRTEDVRYLALIPKVQTTIGNDPKDKIRGLYQD